MSTLLAPPDRPRPSGTAAQRGPVAARPYGDPLGTGDAGPAEVGGLTGKALVLNASTEPLCVVPARRALVLVLTGKADLLHGAGTLCRSERLEVASPSVVQLRRYVRVPYRRRATLTRRGVFIRDGHTCQYCGRPAENIDHVQPRSRNGAHEWENVVAACTRCNSRKGDKTPAEAGMALARAPFAPKAAFWMVVAVGRVRPEWECYLGDALQQAS